MELPAPLAVSASSMRAAVTTRYGLPKVVLRSVIGRRYRLDEIAEAHRYADTGHKVGNVAVLIGDQTEPDLNEAAGAPPPTR